MRGVEPLEVHKIVRNDFRMSEANPAGARAWTARVNPLTSTIIYEHVVSDISNHIEAQVRGVEPIRGSQNRQERFSHERSEPRRGEGMDSPSKSSHPDHYL